MVLARLALARPPLVLKIVFLTVLILKMTPFLTRTKVLVRKVLVLAVLKTTDLTNVLCAPKPSTDSNTRPVISGPTRGKNPTRAPFRDVPNGLVGVMS